MTGKHIELFLVEGVPGGITTAEIAGQTGHVLAGPRSDLGDVLRRPEAKRNGAYFLLGDDEEAVGGVRRYIGRTENFIARFRDHSAKKEFWDRVVLITAKDDSFTEGHWGYLEWRLVELAKQAARVTLANGNDPQGRRLSEAQASDMEAFLEQLQIVLPVLGVNAIRVRAQAAPAQASKDASPVFSLTNAKLKVEATAQQFGDEFTVLRGSRIVGAWCGRLDRGGGRRRRAHAGRAVQVAVLGGGHRAGSLVQRPHRVEARRRAVIRRLGEPRGGVRPRLL